MCGIIGIYGYEDVIDELILGLLTMQHRGQDSAGIVTFDGTFRMKKGLGLVDAVFKDKTREGLTGSCGLGHVRYATMGSTDIFNTQPLAVNYPFGLSMVHNGNVTNFVELRKHLFEERHLLPDTANDLALILYTFASELEKRNLKKKSTDDIFDSVRSTQSRIEGAYSIITQIAGHGFLAFTDPHGIRPLVMGRKVTEKGVVYAFASETTCFDYLGYKTIRDIAPGEAVFIDRDHNVHERICLQKKRAFCVFEYIYFAREDSVINGKTVATVRCDLGKRLASRVQEEQLDVDIIIDVPNSAYYAASGLAEVIGKPYRRGLSENNFIGRSFISSTRCERERLVREKLNPIADVVKGKKLAVVDDSIVRGTTSKHIVKLLRDKGARRVHFIAAAPPIKFPCVYGIDMSTMEEIIAAHYQCGEIARYIEADSVTYLDLEDLKAVFHDLPICHACFSGQYPTRCNKRLLKQIELEKRYSNRT